MAQKEAYEYTQWLEQPANDDSNDLQKICKIN